MQSVLPTHRYFILSAAIVLTLPLLLFPYCVSGITPPAQNNAIQQPASVSDFQSQTGSYIWILITLAFSAALNLFLYRNERKPEKEIQALPESIEAESHKKPQRKKAETRHSLRVKKPVKPRHTFAYQREYSFNRFDNLNTHHQNPERAEISA